MKSFSIDPGYVLNQYESLRQEALEANPFGRRGHGLALFLSCGMKAWIGALKAFVPTTLTGESRNWESHEKQDLSPAVRSDLTLVLTDMILACYEEVTNNERTG